LPSKFQCQSAADKTADAGNEKFHENPMLGGRCIIAAVIGRATTERSPQ
jgi:hypothetical protein